MLTSIRERATGWIAWAIVILITIPFALWGINSYFEGGVNVNVAEFDGGEIDYQTYQRAIYSERDRMRQVYGNNATAELLSGEVLGRQVINRLVNDVLLQRDAHDRGYRISDVQLAEAIRNEPNFQSEQGFSQELYERILQFSGYSPSEFESVQRNNAATQQVQTGFIESVLPINSTVEDLIQLLRQRRTGEYVIVEPSTFLSEIEITDEEIRTDYEENQAIYVDEEKIRIEYIEFAPSDFAVNFTPIEETLREIYDAESQQFREEEQRLVRHILLEGAAGDNAAAIDQANELIYRLNAGEDFAHLASEFSADIGSTSQGGDLGWISRGATVPAFESVAFALSEGEVSEPVESEFGVHVIRVDEIQAEKAKPFEEVRDELAKQAIRNQAEIEMFEIAEEMRNVAFEQPDSLDAASELSGLDIKVSDWFSRTQGTGISSHSNVRDAAFSATVLEDGFNSDLITLDEGRQVLLRKREHHPSETLSFEIVKAEISDKLLFEKSAAKAQEFAENLLTQLTDGGADWNSTIDDHGLETRTISGRTGNEGDQDSAEVASYVYAWEKPGADGVSYGGGPISQGRFAMFRITGVVEGDVGSASVDEQNNLGNIMQLRFGAGLFESYLNQLRDGIDVSINDELL